MKKTKLYVVRHGKTMFNALTRVQGWCDTPLTKEGAQNIQYLGKGLKDIEFEQAYSSDSGRAIETSRLILSELPNGKHLSYTTDKRLREWCFGSLEGGFDSEMWGVIPRVLNFDELQTEQMSFKDIADAIYAADTANWAQTYDELKERVWTGFEDIAYHQEKAGGGNVLVVCHGLTIAFLLNLIDEKQPVRAALENGSVNLIEYANGEFSIHGFNDTSYIDKGRELANS